MKNKLTIILTLFITFIVINAEAQIWYRTQMVSVRGYNNNCDAWPANEEGEFFVQQSDNLNYGTWYSSGCMECDGNMDNGTGVTCTKSNGIAEKADVNVSTLRFENWAYEDDGVSNCDGPGDCNDAMGDQVNYTLTSYSTDAWQTFTRTRGSKWQMTYQFKWTYVVPSSGNKSITLPSGSFVITDKDGPDNSYGLSYDGSMTIYPSTSGCNNKVRANFTAMATEANYDFVDIYDGNSTSAPLLGSWSGTSSPGTITSTACDGSLTIRFRSDGSVVNTGFKATLSTVTVAPFGTAGSSGTNKWYVSAYTCDNITTPTCYMGYYEETSLSYNSATRWTNTPSDASGYLGVKVNTDYHVVQSKRTGFTCAVYQLDIPSHDDDIMVYVNGTNVFTHNGCCDSHTNIWTGYLTSTSTVEVRHRDGVGGSSQSLTLTDVTSALSGGTIGGITDGITICSGGDPGAFTNTVTPSGGTIGITNGSPAAPVYQWQRSTYSNFFSGSNVGTNSTTYDPGTLTAGTYYFRRVVTDACGTVAYSNVIQVVVNTYSVAPTSITGTTTICAGGSTTLSVSGGSLGSGGVWRWYSASCGGTLAGTGTSISVSPASTTTYFVRAEGTCNNTTCASVAVTVNTLSVAPTSITGTTTICAGGSTTLSVSGGSLGTGGVWRWYSASCGGTLLGSGTSIIVSPASTTTYFVRAEGTCNTTTCASRTVTVNTLSTAPTSITGTTTICAGGSTTLSVSGGSLGTGGVWNWYTASCGGTLVGTGTSLVVSPASNTTYYVRAEGTCNTTACASVAVTVNTLSTAPTSITGTTTICAGGSTTLSVSGGSLGTGGVWNWYTASCGGTLVGSGTSLVVSPASTTTYYVRAEGTCNTTSCASVAVTVKTLSTAPTGATASSTFSCTGDAVDLSVAGGSLGTNAAWKWYSDASFSTLVGSGSPLTVYPTATTTYYVRAEGDCNTIGNQSVTVFVNGSSTSPSASVALASSTSSSTCVVADNSWHYFYNSTGELLGAVNSKNQNLGNVTVTITVGDSGPFGTGLAPGVCGYTGAAAGEYVMPRYWDITVANQPSTPVDVIFYYKDSDITSLAATINAQNANYVACWGDVNVEADLMMTVAHTAGGTELFSSLNFANGPNTGAGHRQIGFQLSEFSGGKLHSNNGLYAGNPLPVELVEFTAKTVNNQFVQLNWKTATEINNKGFEVQRSLDGINFEKIGFITGNGNSNLINNYSFQDNNVAKGVYYYKLKQIDFDGEFEYSEIRNASILGDDKIEVSYFIPNPAENNTILNFVVNKDTEVSIAIYDGIGRKVIDRKEVLSTGKNSISFNTTDLAAGVYSTKILIDNEEFARKLVISK